MGELRTDKEKDFLERTLYNLELYNENQNSNSLKYKYEVTMLLNSLLGILVIPKERSSILDKVDINFLEYEGESNTFFRHMRNAIAHGHFIDNIKINEETREIEEITFIDIDPKTKKKFFECTLTIDKLKQLINNIKNNLNI